MTDVRCARTPLHRLPTALLALLACALLSPAGAAAAARSGADAILGTWLTEAGDQGGRAYVAIDKQGGGYVGRIVRLEEPNFPPGDPEAGQPKTDRDNPDPALRDRPIRGLKVLEGFAWAGGDKWTGGTIYDPANGKTYKAQITAKGDYELAIRGYVGIPLFGRTTTWKRVE